MNIVKKPKKVYRLMMSVVKMEKKMVSVDTSTPGRFMYCNKDVTAHEVDAAATMTLIVGKCRRLLI